MFKLSFENTRLFLNHRLLLIYRMSESPYFKSTRLTRSRSCVVEKQIKTSADQSDKSHEEVKKAKSKSAQSRKRPSDKHLKLEYEDESKTSVEQGKTDESKKLKKFPRSDGWTPENWEIILKNIREMRSKRDAPVDTMGCDQTNDQHYSEKEQRYHTLISLMMSSQTKDQVNHAALCRLKDHGLTIDNILKTNDEQLGKLIYPVGFWKKKVNYIKSATEILKNKYNSDIPDTVEGLCSLPGVGPKMAYLAMTVAWKSVVGIGVDTHVHRISNRLKWLEKPTSTPEATRLALEKWLPHDLWEEVNHLLVGFGQTICSPVNPKCNLCQNNKICPVGKSSLKGSKKKK